MKAAGIRRFGGGIEVLDLPGPRAPRASEVLFSVTAAGVGNWDEYVRTGSWDTGARPPMALGVEAAGIVTAVGAHVEGIGVGAAVTAHSVPFSEQGAWADAWLADARHVAVVPSGLPLDSAAAAPVPLLTVGQALDLAGPVGAGQTVLVHGAGGVTGGVLVQLAVHRGARVIATAGPGSAARVRMLGAADVLDYRDPAWAERVRRLAGGGVDAAVNAVRNGSEFTQPTGTGGSSAARLGHGVDATPNRSSRKPCRRSECAQPGHYPRDASRPPSA